MSYTQIQSLIEQTAAKYKGKHSYGYGTLNELNDSNIDFPAIWWVLPLTINDSSVDESTPRMERYPITMRFVSSVKISTYINETSPIYSQTKAMGDGFIYTILDLPDYGGMFTLGPITKRQIWKQADAVLIGWEYSFNIDYFPDVDNCCLPYNEE